MTKGTTMKSNNRVWKTIFIGNLTLLLVVLSCAALQELTNIQTPRVAVDNVRLTGLNLEQVNLAFELSIDNPNALAATLAGLDYDFLLNDNSFISGQQDKQLTIAARGKSQLEIPVSLSFKKIYDTYQSLKNQDSTSYQFACGLSFDLPVLGRTRIPVSKSGQVPLIKVPDIKIRSLKLNKVTLSSADLALKLELDNPNAFSLGLDKLNYFFKINNQTWAQGLSQEKMQLNKKGKSTLSIPISLNLFEMGRTVYGLITGSSELNYNFSGNADLKTSVPLLNNFSLPVEKSGKIKILK